jgi:hypothetical protein
VYGRRLDREPRGPRPDRQGAGVGERAGQLGREERVAVGPVVQLGAQGVVGWRAEHRGHQRGQLLRRERTELDPDQLHAVGQPLDQLVGDQVRCREVRALRRDQGHRRRRRPPGHHGEQGERVVVQLVQVVEEEHQRPGRGERGDQPGHRDAGPAEPGSRRYPRIARQGRQLQRGEHLTAQLLGERVVRDQPSHGRAQRRVRHLPLQPVRADREHPPAPLGEARADLGEQPRLAHPGLAVDDHRDGTHGPDPRDRVEQCAQLGRTPDERLRYRAHLPPGFYCAVASHGR